jgi:hypothetical protein
MVIPCGHIGKARILCGFVHSGFNESADLLAGPRGSRRADLARKREYKKIYFYSCPSWGCYMVAVGSASMICFLLFIFES